MCSFGPRDLGLFEERKRRSGWPNRCSRPRVEWSTFSTVVDVRYRRATDLSPPTAASAKLQKGGRDGGHVRKTPIPHPTAGGAHSPDQGVRKSPSPSPLSMTQRTHHALRCFRARRARLVADRAACRGHRTTYDGGSTPAATASAAAPHHARTGHAPQAGADVVHTVAPTSHTAAARSPGLSAAAPSQPATSAAAWGVAWRVAQRVVVRTAVAAETLASQASQTGRPRCG